MSEELELGGAIGRSASGECKMGQHHLCTDEKCMCRHHQRHWTDKPGAAEKMARLMRPPRPPWDDYFLAIALVVSSRADCLRARYGAVVVDVDHRIVATGYNGSAPGARASCLAGDCPRAYGDAEHNIGDYTDCIALHAEQNAIAFADWRQTQGATIYLNGPTPRGPCSMCSKLIEAAGIDRIVWPV